MKSKLLSVFLIVMIIGFIISTYFLYQSKSTTVSVDAALKQLDYKVKLPTYFPNKILKTEASVEKDDIYQEIRILYSNSNPDQQIILKITDEHIQPSIFADKIKLDNGQEAIHVGSDVFHAPTYNGKPMYTSPNFIKNLQGSTTVVYWEQDGLEYSLYSAIPYPELIKMANSLK